MKFNKMTSIGWWLLLTLNTGAVTVTLTVFKMLIFKRSCKIETAAQSWKDLLVKAGPALSRLLEHLTRASFQALLLYENQIRDTSIIRSYRKIYRTVWLPMTSVTMLGEERGQKGRQRRKKWESLASAFSHWLRQRMNLNCAKSLRIQVLPCKKGYRL